METSNNILVSWLRLVRLPATPSAVSNILVGYLAANGNWQPAPSLGWLILSSLALYLSGMVSNDLFDVNRDRQNDRRRPLVTNEISVQAGTIGCILLMLTGLAGAAMAGWKSFVVAIVLLGCILLYNGPLKTTPIAPFLMGACRSLNILLGASTTPWQTGFSQKVLWISLSLGILIWGLTLFARNESQVSSRSKLLPGTIWMLLGLVGYGTLGFIDQPANPRNWLLPILIGLIVAPVARHIVRAIQTCQPRDVQRSVISVLQSLILLDAALCLWLGQPDVSYAIIVLLLLIPSRLLGKWISMT